jgi:hypothetical protein
MLNEGPLPGSSIVFPSGGFEVGSRHPIYAVLQPHPLLLFRRNQFRLFDIINPSRRVTRPIDA